jgi:hypothetical protein
VPTSLTPSPIIRHATAVTQRRDQLALVLRLHAGKDRVVDRAAAQAPASCGSSDPVVTRPSVSMPAARATAATVAGPSPEMTLTFTPVRCR